MTLYNQLQLADNLHISNHHRMIVMMLGRCDNKLAQTSTLLGPQKLFRNRIIPVILCLFIAEPYKDSRGQCYCGFVLFTSCLYKCIVQLLNIIYTVLI